jgi:uncharacterized protein YdaU (DUF1376 family)
MNWYPHFPGDYIRDTAHLSVIQHGAYRLLLDHYYATAAPLPADVDGLYRICRAFDQSERTAVGFVLGQFFELRADGYHNRRADRQLVTQKEQHERLSEGARKTNAKRWGKPSPSDSPSDSPGARISRTRTRTKYQNQREEKNPAAKPTRRVDPRYVPFGRFAFGAFEAKYGRKPSWQKKDWKGLKNLLAAAPTLSVSELQTRWTDFLASTEAFTEKQGGSLAYFCSHADSFISGPLLERTKGGSNAKPSLVDAIETTLRSHVNAERLTN